MQAARIVYIGLFILLILPILWMGYQKARKSAARKRLIPASFAILAIVLLAWFMHTLYAYTVVHQPELVIDRFMEDWLDKVAVEGPAASPDHDLAAPDADLAAASELAASLHIPYIMEVSKTSHPAGDDSAFYLLLGSNEVVAEIVLTMDGENGVYQVKALRILDAAANANIRETQTFTLIRD